MSCICLFLMLLLLESVVNGQTGTTAKYVLVAGNDPQSRTGKVWIKSNFMTSSIKVVSIAGDHAVSPACGPHPARCRTLTVNSTLYEDYRSSHTVFVPLEDGLYILYLELMYNGTAQLPAGYSLSIDYQKTMTLEFSETVCSSDCVSLGVYEVGVQFYSLCATLPSILCTCELETDSVGGYSFRRCHTFVVSNLGSRYENMSNVVTLSNDNLLMFIIGSIPHQLNPIEGTSQTLDSIHDVCTSVTQLSIDNTKSIVYIYCTNGSNTFNVGTNSITRRFQGKFFYPCSTNTNITVNLMASRGENVDITYKEGDTEMHTFLPGTTSFISGKCITYRDNDIFLYGDQSGGIYLFNVTTNTFSNLSHQTHELQVFGSRYPTVIDHKGRAVTVFDLENFSLPLIDLFQVSPQLVTLIYDLPLPIPVTQTTTQGTTTFSPDRNINLPAAILVPLVTFLICCIVAIGITCTLCSRSTRRHLYCLRYDSHRERLVHESDEISDYHENPIATNHEHIDSHDGNDADQDARVDEEQLMTEVVPQEEQTQRPNNEPDNSHQQVISSRSPPTVERSAAVPENSDTPTNVAPCSEVRSDRNGQNRLSHAYENPIANNHEHIVLPTIDSHDDQGACVDDEQLRTEVVPQEEQTHRPTVERSATVPENSDTPTNVAPHYEVRSDRNGQDRLSLAVGQQSDIEHTSTP